MGKDPIVLGSQIVNALQTLVSRELNPLDAGVVTVGSFQSGFVHNIIPDPEMTDRVMAAVGKSIGEEKVITQPPSMGGEDFSRYHRYDRDIKTLIFWTGGAEPKAYKAAAAGKGDLPPGNHSPFFAPQPEAALKLGVQAMTAGTLELFDE